MLKPEVAESQRLESSVPPAEAKIENVERKQQSLAPLIVEGDENECASDASENVSSSVWSKETATVAEGKRDEFLDFI